ncbi:MAG: serine protease [Actinobacteria bacterium]|nr:serine protease [Actinomycetota bacterium]
MMRRRPAIGEWTKMLVNEQFRKCVTFLYTDVQTDTGGIERIPVGSAFFVGVPLFDDMPESYSALYAVTARHVIDSGAQLWIRMRTTSGQVVDRPVAADAWEQHPHTDVAVAGVHAPDDFDLIAVSPASFATESFVQQHRVGEGDDVFFSGLFVGHYGKAAPQPLIRFGNIALMPREPVRVEISKYPKTETDIEAYLVEARSWGGQSGSPAFVSFPAQREVGGPITFGDTPPFALLGLVQGGWKHPEGAKAPDPSGEGFVEVNMGISVVVPAYKIMEVLMSETLARPRAEAAAQLEPTRGSKVAPSATSAGGDAGEFERFEDLTQKLVNIPKREIDEKRVSGET